MTPGARFLVFLALCGASGWTGVQHWEHRGERADPMTLPDARKAALELNLASAQLELVKSTVADTYDGPDLKNFAGLTLVWADELGYCIEVLRGTKTYFTRGPGGRPAPGACPRV
jgi:hypothetical protein